jgi:hypothetical protein
MLHSVPYYLGRFDTNYIIFKNVETFHQKNQLTKSCEGIYWVFKNILLVEMKTSKLINYLMDMRQTWQGLTRYYYGSHVSLSLEKNIVTLTQNIGLVFATLLQSMLFNISTYWAKYSLHSQLNSPPQTQKQRPSLQPIYKFSTQGFWEPHFEKSLEEHTGNPRIQGFEVPSSKLQSRFDQNLKH